MNDYVAGSTSVVESIFLQDSTQTNGSGKTGLLFNTAGLTCYYKRSNGAAAVAVPLMDIATLGTFLSGGFKEIDAVHQPGLYEFHPPDAAFAAGAKHVTFYFVGATGLAARPLKFRLVAVNPDDVNGLLDVADGVESGETLRQCLRLLRAVIVGKCNGFPTGPAHFRDKADSKDRVTATVDGSGNRTAITTDVS